MTSRSAAREPPARQTWDVFCGVVDHFGDAAVAWRLARALAREHDLGVRLWIDVPEVLARLVPEVEPNAATSLVDGVAVRALARLDERVTPADVVVEAFGCGIPASYLERMAARAPAPRWFVLEYLSAEGWVESMHGLPSPHPQLPLLRRFWWPGFTSRTGGLLRERDLFARRDAFMADAAQRDAFLRRIGVGPQEAGSLLVSLFCYAEAPIAELVAAWRDAQRPVRCVVPAGVVRPVLHAALGRELAPGSPLRQGSLEVVEVPFLPQDAYDELLWSCDVNFVRGEDSFVRAQWAGRPFVWQAYPQAAAAHVPKVDAFLARYCDGLDPLSAAALERVFRAWNRDAPGPELAPAWDALAARWSLLAPHALSWATELAKLPELASTLVQAASVTL